MTYCTQQKKLIRMAKDLYEIDLEKMHEALQAAGVNSSFLEKKKRIAFVPVLYQIAELIEHFRSIQDQVGSTLQLLEAELKKAEKLTSAMEGQAGPNGKDMKRPNRNTGRPRASLPRSMRKVG